MPLYECTDDATDDAEIIVVEAETPQDALVQYIVDALDSPHLYDTGEGGVSPIYTAYCYLDPERGTVAKRSFEFTGDE